MVEWATIYLLLNNYILMKVKVLVLLVFLGFSTCFGQQNVILKEDFEGFENNWQFINTKEFKVNQEAGKLSIRKATENRIMNGCMWYKKTVPSFNTDKNFSIEFEAKSITSEFASSCFDFIWGKIQEYDGTRKLSIYQIDFNLTKVRLAKFDLFKGWKYYEWSNELKDSSLSAFKIERGNFNKFEIVQKDNIIMVKVNNTLVYKMPIELQNIGSEIGFQQCLKSEWEIDNIVIKQ